MDQNSLQQSPCEHTLVYMSEPILVVTIIHTSCLKFSLSWRNNLILKTIVCNFDTEANSLVMSSTSLDALLVDTQYLQSASMEEHFHTKIMGTRRMTKR